MSALGTIGVTRQGQLRDGRKIAFAEYGKPDGTPVFFFHGLPGTRLYRHPDDALTASLGVRLITIDRPGLGLSDRQPNRTLLDWPSDVQAIADALHIERFAVLGHAAGGPYAAVCAWKLPHRVSSATLVAPSLPKRIRQSHVRTYRGLHMFYRTIRHVPWLLKPALRTLWWFARHYHDRASIFRQILRRFPTIDRDLFQRNPGLFDMMTSNIEELQQSGSGGCAEDFTIATRSWGFRLGDISIPVHVWWGKADREVSEEIAQKMANELPKSQLTIVPDAGHYVIFSHWREILSHILF